MKETIKKFTWVVLGIVIALIVVAILQGQRISGINANADGFGVTFDEIKEIPRDELDERQDELEDRLRDIEADLEDEAGSGNSTQYDLSGRWRSDFGNFYNIDQFGNTITIQEVNPVYGVTAIGDGVINGNVINISYTTAAYTQGSGTMEINRNGQQLAARFQDFMTGMVTNFTLYR